LVLLELVVWTRSGSEGAN